MTPQESFIDFLVKEGYVTPIQLLKSSQIQSQQGGDLFQILVMMDFISRERLNHAQLRHQQWITQHPAPVVPSIFSTSPYPVPSPPINGGSPIYFQSISPELMPPPTGVLTESDAIPDSSDVIDDIRHSSNKVLGGNETRPQPEADDDSDPYLAPPTEIEDHSHILSLLQPIPTPPLQKTPLPESSQLATFLPPPTPPDPVPHVFAKQSPPPVSRAMQTIAYDTSPFSQAHLQVPIGTNTTSPILDALEEDVVPSQEIIDSLDELFEQVMILEPGTEPQTADVTTLPAAPTPQPLSDAMKTLATDMELPDSLIQQYLTSIGAAVDPQSPSVGSGISSEQQTLTPSPAFFEPLSPLDEDSPDIILLDHPSQPNLQQDPLLGQWLDQRFLIQENIAQQVGCSLYHALDQSTGKSVCLRRMPFFAFINNQQMFRFKKEAEQLLSLHHTHLASILAYGVHPSWGAYLIHEPMLGETLREYMFLPQPFVLHDLLPTFEKICTALDHLHQRGIPHRNLNLSCLQWDSPGHSALSQLKLIPTGTTPMAFSELTMPWMLALHANYPVGLCPELLRGFPADLTPRADIYALGLILFQLLTRQSAFSGETLLHLLQQHAYTQPLPLDVVVPETPYPPALQILISTSLNKDPGRRPPSAMLWLDTLQRAILDAPDTPLPSTSPQVPLQRESDIILQQQANQWLTRLQYPTLAEPLPARSMLIKMARTLRQPRLKSRSSAEPSAQHRLSLGHGSHAAQGFSAITSSRNTPTSPPPQSYAVPVVRKSGSGGKS